MANYVKLFVLFAIVCAVLFAAIAPAYAGAVYEFVAAGVSNVYAGETWVNATQGDVLVCDFMSPKVGDYVLINGKQFYVSVVAGYTTREKYEFPMGASLYMGSHFALCSVELQSAPAPAPVEAQEKRLWLR